MYVATAIVNVGIIAVDDYTMAIAPIIPAQNHSVAQIINDAGFRSAVPTLILFSLSRLALNLGLNDPANQFRFVLVILGVASFLIQATFGAKQFKETEQKKIFVFLIGFYFACPLFFTRPMIEALSAPFITVSAYCARGYWESPKKAPLALATIFLAIASLFRFQVGVCVLALIAVVLLRKRHRDLPWLVLVGATCFVVSGLIDWRLRGSFHYSLLSYLKYNLALSSTFGTTPFYSFALLFLGLSFPPVLFRRFPGFEWKKEYGQLLPTLIYFVAFVISHSLVPHKEERFMIPVLPLFLVLLTPMVEHLLRKGFFQWRVAYFVVLNFLLLGLASFNIAQKNVVGLAIYLQQHPHIDSIFSVEDTLLYLFPTAFISRKVEHRGVKSSELDKLRPTCRQAVALRSDYNTPQLNTQFKQLAAFSPGILEWIVVKLNPGQNSRRAAVELWVSKDCP